MCVGATYASATEAKLTNGSAISAGTLEPAEPTQAVSERDEPGLSQKAVEIARPFGFPITNSMVVSWIVAVALIVFAQIATRHMKPVPEGAQNFCEWLVEGLYTFLEGIIGSHLVERTFWFFATVSFSFFSRIG
jgi:F-type H+-transporting ATPase subunit a